MAVITSFMIGSTNVVPYVQERSLRVERRANGRAILTCVLRDKTGGAASYRPALREVATLVMDAATSFYGIVWTIRERPIINNVGVELEVSCVDLSALLERVYFNGPIPGGTLRSVVQVLHQNALVHGISLDPTMAAGPTVGAQSFPFVTLTDAFDQLSLESGWPWRMSVTGAIGYYEPGTVASPFNLTEATCAACDVEKDQETYVNEVWVRYGEGQREVTQRLQGNGTAREWVLENDLQITNTGVTPTGFVVVTRGATISNETIDADYVAGTGQWHYDRANIWNQRIIHDSGEAVLTTGQYADVTYLAQFPGAVLARDNAEYLANGPFTRVVDLTTVFDRTAAASYGDALLRRDGGNMRWLTATTYDDGLLPLQTNEVTLPRRQLSAVDFLITEVTMQHRFHNGTEHHFAFDVRAVEGNEWRENWLQYYLPERRDRGFGVVPPDGSGGVGGPAPPTSTPNPEFVTTGLTCSPIAARGAQLDTSSAAAWTNTSYVELLSTASSPSTHFVICGLQVESLQDVSEQEFDIALGLAGSEQVYATLRVGGNTRQSPSVLWLPIPHGPVTPGTRVSVRSRYDDEIAQAVHSQYVKLLYYAAQPSGISTTTRVFRVAPLSSALTVTASASAWVNGSWAQVTAATTEPWQLASVTITEGDIPFDASGDEIEVDVGVGAAASEAVITTVRFHTRQGVSVSQGVVLDPVLISAIATGARVAVRARHRRASALTFNLALQYYGGTM